MKKTRKFAAFIAALTLAACSVAPAMMINVSAESQNVTVKVQTDGKTENTDADKTEHTYTAYQIFAGEYADSQFKITGFGSNVNTGTLLANDSAFMRFKKT